MAVSPQPLRRRATESSLWPGVARGKGTLVEFEWSPIEVDRQLARAFAQWRAWRARLEVSADAEDDPLAYFRPILGQSFFETLAELPESDPLREPLRRFVYRLAEQRIDQAVLTRLAEEWHLERPHPETPGPAQSALGLRERTVSDPPRRAIWARLWVDAAPPISAIAIDLWQRRREIARRMGLDGPERIESPGPGIREAARRVANATRDRIRELRIGSLHAFIELALGRDVAGDWPGRLTPGHLLDFFRDGDLLRSLDLEPRRLPASLGSASTLRALGSLGAAWLEALAPRDQPFVVAHDPYGLKRHQAAASFALLPLNERFLTRHFGVPAHARPDAQRRLAQVALLELARAAFRVELRAHALQGERAFREAFGELAQHDLDLSLPPHAAGVIFPLAIEDEQRFVGILLAAHEHHRLVEAHDEDWFRNPRAIEQLRSEARMPPAVHVSAEELAAAEAFALGRLERLLR